MAKNRSVKFNFLMNSILTVSTMVFPMITFPYVSRIIHPVGTGAVDFAFSVVTYFSMFAQMGIPTYGIKICAAVRDDREVLSRTVQEILLLNMVTCGLVYLLFGAALWAVPLFQEEKTLLIVMSSLILLNTVGCEWLYKALEKYSYITVRSIVFKLISMAAIFLLVRKEQDYILYGALYIFAAVGSNLLNFFNLRKLIDFRKTGTYEFKRHLKPIGVFFAMSVATTIYTNLDSVMITFIRGKAENGCYGAAVKIKVVLVNLVTSLGTVLLPRVSYYYEKKRFDEFYQICGKALEFAMVAALPLTVYFALFAGPSVYLLSGAEYAGAILPMRIIMPTLAFIAVTNILGIQMLIPMGKEKIVLYSELVGAAVDVIVNAWLIPQIGASGAAAGTAVAELSVLLVQLAALRTEVFPVLRKIPFRKIGAALLGSVLAVIWIPQAGTEPGENFVLLAGSAFLFFSVYASLLILLKEPFVREYFDRAIRIAGGKKKQ